MTSGRRIARLRSEGPRSVLARAVALLGLVLVPAAAPAFGADGRGEINMAAVAAAGGFPYAISQPGSYVLTGDLRVPDENTTAIEITADDVTLDLNGFTISGVTECSPSGTMCAPIGLGSGIRIFSTNVAVHNGTIRGMGSRGILAFGAGNRVENVRALFTPGTAITLGEDSTIAGCKALRNGGRGLLIGDGSLLASNTAADNVLPGIDASDASVLFGNTVTDNQFGIAIFSYGVVRSNTSNSNEALGIDASFGSVVVGNALRQNDSNGINCSPGSTVRANTVETNGRGGIGQGILAGRGSTVLGNASRLNTGAGIVVGNESGYGDNVASDNGGAEFDPDPTAAPVGCNLADGTANCPVCP